MKLVQVAWCLAVLCFTAENASAQLSNEDQKCVNTINKGAANVHAAQGKANTRCVQHYISGKVASAEDCLLNPTSRVEALQTKLVAKEATTCESIPPFASTNAAYAGDAAYQGAVDLMHDIFSLPLETGLHRCDTHPAECLCEWQVSKRVEQLLRAMNKAFLTCKRAALAVGREPFPDGAAGVGEFAQCISNEALTLSVEADATGMIADTAQDLLDTVTELCFTTATNEFANSVCNTFDDNPSGLTSCVVDQAECYVCHLYKSIDALGAAIDCQAWSDAPTCAP